MVLLGLHWRLASVISGGGAAGGWGSSVAQWTAFLAYARQGSAAGLYTGPDLAEAGEIEGLGAVLEKGAREEAVALVPVPEVRVRGRPEPSHHPRAVRVSRPVQVRLQPEEADGPDVDARGWGTALVASLKPSTSPTQKPGGGALVWLLRWVRAASVGSTPSRPKVMG